MNEFDTKALTWDDNPLNIDRSKAIAEKIREMIPLQPKMNGFEYGCGTGLISQNLMPFLNTITLADSSEGMLNMLKQKIQQEKITTMAVLKTDLISDELPTQKFDLIYTAMTIHHIMDVNLILSKFYKMLNPSGVLCVIDLDIEDGSFHGSGFSGHLGFSRENMKNMFEKNGFTNVQSETCYEIVRKNEEGQTQSFPLFLMAGKKPEINS